MIGLVLHGVLRKIFNRQHRLVAVRMHDMVNVAIHDQQIRLFPFNQPLPHIGVVVAEFIYHFP